MQKKRLSVVLTVCMVFLFVAVQASAGDYLNSSHGNSTTGVDRSALGAGVAQLSTYSVGNCAHCHEQHASIEGTEPAPVGGGQSYLGFDLEEELCFFCHDANGPASTDIAGEYAKTSKHPQLTNSGVHLAGENTAAAFGPGSRHAECTDCHNPHIATARPATNDPTKGPIIGASGLDPGVRGAGDSGITVTYTFVPNVLNSNEQYKVCYKCHSAWNNSPSAADGAFNTANDSFHWVESDKYTYVPNPGTTGKGIYHNAQFNLTYTQIMMPRPSLANVDASYRILSLRCSDCHGTDNATAATIEGPHGNSSTPSTFIGGNILKVPAGSPYTTWTATSGIPQGGGATTIWCFNCHHPQFTGTGFKESGGGGTNLHLEKHHVDKAFCQDCHLANPHGQTASGTADQRQHLLKPSVFTDLIDTNTANTTSGSYDEGAHSYVLSGCT